MNRNWLGIAEDLTPDGVVGEPYREPTLVSQVTPSAYPAPPRHGGLKALLIIAAIGGGMVTAPGQHALRWIKAGMFGSEPQVIQSTSAPGSGANDSAGAKDRVEGSALAGVAGASSSQPATPSKPPVLKKKTGAPKKAAALHQTDEKSAGAAHPGEPSAGTPGDTELDLEKIRNLNRGL